LAGRDFLGTASRLARERHTDLSIQITKKQQKKDLDPGAVSACSAVSGFFRVTLRQCGQTGGVAIPIHGADAA
jgi:hypothetical protein